MKVCYKLILKYDSSFLGGGQAPTPPVVKTLNCFLCGGRQVYPGPRYANHLINEHGVVDIDFMIELSLYKQRHGRNPNLNEAPVSKHFFQATLIKKCCLLAEVKSYHIYIS